MGSLALAAAAPSSPPSVSPLASAGRRAGPAEKPPPWRERGRGRQAVVREGQGNGKTGNRSEQHSRKRRQCHVRPDLEDGGGGPAVVSNAVSNYGGAVDGACGGELQCPVERGAHMYEGKYSRTKHQFTP